MTNMLLKLCLLLVVMVSASTATRAESCSSLDELNWLTGKWTFQGNGITVETTYTRISDTEIQKTLHTSLTKDGSELGPGEITKIVFNKGKVFLEEADDSNSVVRFDAQTCSDEGLVLAGEMYGTLRTYTLAKRSDNELFSSLSFGSRKSRGSVHRRIE